MKLPVPSRWARRSGRSAQGYILLTLILFVALLAIAMTVMVPVIRQQVKRDREEELINRGVQYSRAIKHYVKKFGRYPTKLEDLENTNNVRFLRKRYKDPVTGKDFKLLHFGEVQGSFGPGIAGAAPAASLTAISQAPGTLANSAFGNTSSFGGNTFGGNNPGGGFGGSAFAGSNPGGSSLGGGASGGVTNSGSPTQATGTNAAQGSPATSPDQSQAADATTAGQKVSGQPDQPETSATKVFGGGPIVGVASLSKEKSIRVFNKKDHYYQWQFIYDPATDRGGLLATPNQPGLQSLGGGLQQAVPSQPGAQNSPFGTRGSTFGFQGGTQTPAGGMQPTQPPPLQQQLPQGPQSAFPPDQGPQE